MEDFKWLASLGVGGVLAGVIFWFYRIDRLNTRELWEEHIKNMHEMIDRMDKKEEVRLEVYRAEAQETRGVLRALSATLFRHAP